MKNPVKASDLSLIEPVINKYKNTVGSLITVLQEIQDMGVTIAHVTLHVGL